MELLLPDSFFDEYREFTVEQISRMTGYHKQLIELRIRSKDETKDIYSRSF
nr:MAG TPA: HTH-type transcriptional regulator [Caudoviricetes sp.]